MFTKQTPASVAFIVLSVLLCLGGWYLLLRAQKNRTAAAYPRFIQNILLSCGFLLLGYPLVQLQKLWWGKHVPLFYIKNMTLIDETEDFIDIGITRTGALHAFYWDTADNRFHVKALKFSAANPSAPPQAAAFHSTARTYYKHSSPWLPLALSRANVLLTGSWEQPPAARAQRFVLRATVAENKSENERAQENVSSSHTPAPNIAPLYTLTAEYFYYTTKIAGSPRYTLKAVALRAHAKNAAQETFLTQTNTGHHYAPFYWREQELLSYLSIERHTQQPDHNAAFQTLLNIRQRSGESFYRTRLSLSEKPQLPLIKLASDVSGQFLGYTSPSGNATLNFLYTTSPAQLTDTNTRGADTKREPPVAFEVNVPQLRAIHSFAFTPGDRLPGGLIIVGLHKTAASGTAAQLYWAGIAPKHVRTQPLQTAHALLSVICLLLACISIAMARRRQQR